MTFDATPLPVGASITPDGFFQYTPPHDTIGCGGTAELGIEFLVTDTGGNQASEVVPVSVFDAPTGALYDQADAQLAWARTLAFFKAHLT
jgi:hypothetical protein